METLQTNGTANPAEEIWAILREGAQRHEELKQQIQETGRLMKEGAQRHEETRKLMRETFDRMDKRSDRLDKQIGELSKRFGEMVEHMVIPNLLTKFEQLGFTFTKANRTEIKDREHGIFTEVDAFLENGDKVMIVEIKNKPKIGDIDEHIERMEKLRRYADMRNDKRVYLGAVAGVVFSESEKIYALKKGFYVIEPSGDTFAITVPRGEYYPHEW
jgi:hypothetical protein